MSNENEPGVALNKTITTEQHIAAVEAEMTDAGNPTDIEAEQLAQDAHSRLISLDVSNVELLDKLFAREPLTPAEEAVLDQLAARTGPSMRDIIDSASGLFEPAPDTAQEPVSDNPEAAAPTATNSVIFRKVNDDWTAVHGDAATVMATNKFTFENDLDMLDIRLRKVETRQYLNIGAECAMLVMLILLLFGK